MKIAYNVPGYSLSGIKTGGLVDVCFEVFCEEDIWKALSLGEAENKQTLMVGEGSNILISDQGYRGILIKNQFSQIQVDKKRREVTVASGTPLSAIVSRYKETNLTGMEYFVGVPGTLGGALMSRVYVGGLFLHALVKRVEVIDRDRKKKWVPMEYVLQHLLANQEPECILRAVLICSPIQPEVLQERWWRYTRERLKKYHSQPSLFCPYVGLTAQALQVLCSQESFPLESKQAHFWKEYENYVVNVGGAMSEDVLRLAQGVQDAFYQLTGQSLVLNVKLIGDFYS